MKHARLAVLVCLLMAFFAPPAQATRFTGTYLLYVCGSDKDGKELTPGGHITCQSYIAGVLDYHNLIHSLGTSPSVDFCVPQDVGLDVLQQIVGRYLAQNKDQGPFVASPAVALALFEAYPCR